MTRLLALSFWISLLPLLLQAAEEVHIPFYSETITLPYDKGMDLPMNIKIEDPVLTQYYQQLERTNYQPLLRTLLEIQSEKQLNDWLFYELMEKAVSKILAHRSDLRKQLTLWFLLSKAGFDTRLTYIKGHVFVYVYTIEELFEVPMVEENDRTFANLTSIGAKRKTRSALYMLNFKPNPKGKSFNFYLRKLPKLKASPIALQLEFTHRDTRHTLELEADQTAKAIMQSYPLMHEAQYLQIPFSSIAESSLFPKLKKLLTGKTKAEAIEILVAFTRSSFRYKEDKSFFGYSKPMIAEEVFLYPYSDCEDRVALLFTMVKQLLDLSMVVIAYEDHLTLAIEIPNMRGDAVKYKDRIFYFCDPTGPVDSHEIGRIPYGYEEKSFDIIGAYIPDTP
jgi:hypothetical protein